MENSLNDVIIGKNFKHKIDSFKNKDLVIIIDFDGTLSKTCSIDKKFINSISVFRNTDYLGKDYNKESQKMFEFYHKIENDTRLDRSLKHKLMIEWWKKEFDLLKRYNLTKDIVSLISSKGHIFLKENFDRFLELSKKHRIIIFSGGIKNIIETYLDRYDRTNITLIANEICFDHKKEFIDKKRLLVTTNKDEKYIKIHHFDVYEDIKNKPMIIIGDNIHDIEIFKDKKDLIRILLFSEDIDETILKKYDIDVLIRNDNDLKSVLDIIDKIIR